MYVYENSICRSIGARPVVEPVDISAMKLPAVLQQYAEVKVIVSSKYFKGKQWFYLHDYFNELVLFGGTIVEWFASLGNRGLDTKQGEPNTKELTVRFQDARRWWIRMKPAIIEWNPDRKVEYDDANDILLHKEKMENSRVFNSTLFTVNGYLHRAAISDEGIYVIGGCTSTKIANEHNVGLLMFDKLSTLKCYDVTENQVLPPQEYAEYKESVLLNTPFNTKGKSVGIVIGGILYWNNKVITVVGENLVSLRTEYIDFQDRYFYDRDWIDTTSIEKLAAAKGGDYITSDEYQSNAVIKSWLVDSKQSFWVVFDNDALKVEAIPLERFNWSGITSPGLTENLPVLLNSGVIAEPLLRPGKSKHIIHTRHHKRREGLARTIRHKDEEVVQEAGMMPRPFSVPKAYWLKISTY